VSQPFEHITKKLGMSYEKLFENINELQKSGVMRRFASILNHRKAGFNANAMVVWNIDEKVAVACGETAASYSAVSHCYLRPKYAKWQYNLFTMIHGKTKEDTQKVIDSIKDEIKANDYMPLYSSREFKKIRLKYFTNEEKIWEKRYI
jgi:DNA-binding Lrp family transcriptional regulator